MITGQEILNFVGEGSIRLVTFIGIIVASIILQKIVVFIVNRNLKRASKLGKRNETQYKFFKHFFSAVIIITGFILAIYSIPSLKTLAVSLFAGAGILAVIIGFASQHAFSNIVSGIFIVIFKPFSIGDRISIGTDLTGIVEDINLRHTVIRSFENRRMIIPNSIISSEKIENSSIEDEKICKFIEYGISYDSDMKKALKILEEEALKHPLHIDNRTKEEKKKKEPIVKTIVSSLGDSSVNIRAFVWTKNAIDAFNLSCDLNRIIKERFEKEGIDIPFPHRTIVFKKDIDKEKLNSMKKKNKKK